VFAHNFGEFADRSKMFNFCSGGGGEREAELFKEVGGRAKHLIMFRQDRDVAVGRV
jgi:hypothetical protein